MSQPTYKDFSGQDNLSSKAMEVVNYKINPDITGAPLSCVTVMPLHLSDESQEVIEFTSISLGEGQEFSQLAYDHKLKPADKRKLVRKLFQAHIASTPIKLVSQHEVDTALAKLGGKATDSALSKQVGCGWQLRGTITEFSVQRMGIYSALKVGAKMQLVRAADGFIIWEGSHLATSQEGAVPLSPIDLMVGVFRANQIINADEMESVTSDLARRLVRTMPLDSKNILVAAARINHLFRVTSQGLNLRAGPGIKYSVTKVLKSSEQVALVSDKKRAPWYQVKTADGVEGYVSKKFLAPM
ncbi:MAG: SH3 domain-containing protein [Sedimenticola sp.]